MAQLVLASQSATDLSNPGFSRERLLNLYIRSFPSGAKSPALIKRTAGLTAWLDLGTGAQVRELLHVPGDGLLYAVSDGKLYSTPETPAATQRGSGINDNHNTTMAANQNGEVAIAAGGTYYTWDKTTFATPTMNALTGVQQVAGDGNYIFLADTSSGRIQSTAIGDVNTLAALDFANADEQPDRIRAIAWNGAYLYVLGTTTVETWRETGGNNFPYSREQGTTIMKGIAAARSIATEGNSIFYISQDWTVQEIRDGRRYEVSTPALSRILQEYTDFSTVTGCTFAEGAHKFYQIRFSDRASWSYDQKTTFWHERCSSQTDDLIPSKIVSSAQAFGLQLIGGDDGIIYKVDETAIKEGADTLLRLIRTPPIVTDGDEVTLDRVGIDVKTGGTDIGRDASIDLCISEDGETWSPPMTRNMGGFANRTRRVEWHGLGQADEHHLEFRITDPIDVSFYGGRIDIS
ncbi:MAG: hypothetical protein AAFU68_02715 [Pseudomonadota bacterium]